MHHPHLPQPRLMTQNTSYLSTIRDLASRSATPKNIPGSTPTATRPVNTGEVHMTCPRSPQATSTQTRNPPPPTRKLLPGQARAARAKARSASPPPPDKLRVRWPLRLKRDPSPSQVPNDAFLLLASPPPLTQTPSLLPRPSQTSLLASSANRTASSPWVSLPRSTLEALSRSQSWTRLPQQPHTPPTLTPSPGPSTSPSQ